jgi:hypothetical protein
VQTVGIIGLTLLAGFLFIKFQYIKGALTEAINNSALLYTKAMEAERERGKVEREMEFLKSSIIQMLNRPVVAALSDQQVNAIAQPLIQYISAVGDPKKLN